MQNNESSGGTHSLRNLELARRAIEAIVMVATDPIPDGILAQVTELPIEIIRALCQEIALSYQIDERGFQFVEVAGGWRYQSHPDLADYVERYVREGQVARLSGAALETLAIIAYKQPISRAQASAIRGVSVDGVLRTLEQRGYVEEKGRDDGPGQAILFGTTTAFLERLGLASVSDLPALGEFVPSAAIVEALEETLRVGTDGERPSGQTIEDIDKLDVLQVASVEDDAGGPLAGEYDREVVDQFVDGPDGLASESSTPAIDRPNPPVDENEDPEVMSSETAASDPNERP